MWQDEALQFSLRMVLGAILVAAGLLKLTDRAAFRRSLNSYAIAQSKQLVTIASILLPPAELLTGLLLLAGFLTNVAASSATLLFAIFVAAVGVQAYRGLTVDCGCLGSRGVETTGWIATGRNIFLMIVAGVLTAGEPATGVDSVLWYDKSWLPSEALPTCLIVIGVLCAYVLSMEVSGLIRRTPVV